MTKLSPIITVFIQIIITSCTLFIVYMIYALLDMDDFDMISSIGFLVFQPLFAFILIAITIAACLLVGLPIRLNKKLHQWWYTKPVIPILGAIIGSLFLVCSFLPEWRETQEVIINDEPVQKQTPNTMLSIMGWCIMAFSLLHFYPQSLRKLNRNDNIVY